MFSDRPAGKEVKFVRFVYQHLKANLTTKDKLQNLFLGFFMSNFKVVVELLHLLLPLQQQIILVLKLQCFVFNRVTKSVSKILVK